MQGNWAAPGNCHDNGQLQPGPFGAAMKYSFSPFSDLRSSGRSAWLIASQGYGEIYIY